MQCRCRRCSCLELVNMAMEGLRFCNSWFLMSCVLLLALAAGNETLTSQNKVISFLNATTNVMPTAACKLD